MAKYVNKSKKVINELALDLFSGKIFTSDHIRENDRSLMTSIFMPILFSEDDFVE